MMPTGAFMKFQQLGRLLQNYSVKMSLLKSYLNWPCGLLELHMFGHVNLRLHRDVESGNFPAILYKPLTSYD